MSKPSVLAESIFVGREAELQKLQSLLNSVIAGKGKTVFVSGEAGSGKSRLAREFLQAAIKQGVAVMAGWCLSDSQVPYFPFTESFNNYYAAQDIEESTVSLLQPQANLGLGTPMRLGTESEVGELTSWLTGQKPSGKAGELSPEAWKDQVFVAVSETLHTIATQNPLILFLEDAQWADSASLALLHYVARAINNSERILVLATYRSEGLTADAEGNAHPLTETLRVMRREELFTEINLSGLNLASISKMAEGMIGGNLHQELAAKLIIESKGNPLFVVESVRMLHEHKSLVLENSEWRLAVDEIGIPSKIKDIVLRRLSCLKYAQRRVLDAASVIGEEFDVELLSTVLGQDVLEVLETLNLVANSTSLVSAEENRYRFDHARSREVLYEVLPSPLKRGYHKRIAEKLESNNHQNLPLSDLAYHYAQAGSTDKSVKFALEAAKYESARWSNVEAIKHFKYVIQAVGEKQEYIKEKETALEGLGDALFGYGMFKESVKTFEQLAYSTQDNNLKFQALIKAMMNPAMLLGDAHTMKELLKKAEPYAAGNRLKKARLILQMGRASVLEGINLTKRLEYFEESFRIFEEECPFKWQEQKYFQDGPWLALLGLTINHPRVGKFREAVAEALLGVAWAEEIDALRLEAAYAYAGHTFNSCFLPDQALIFCAKPKEIYQKTKIGHTTLVLADVFSAWTLTQKGDFQAALTHALAAVEFSKKTDSNSDKAITYSTLTRIYALLGNVENSNVFFAKLIELPAELYSHAYVFGELTKAVHLAVNGKCIESNEIFQDILGEVQKFSAHIWQFAFVHLLYGWSLNLQGRFEEASFHLKKIQEFSNEIKPNFDHTYLQTNLMVCRKVEVGSEFEMRLDIINASSKAAQKVNVEGLIFPNFKVEGLPIWITQQEAKSDVNNKVIDPFKVETLKLKLKAKEEATLPLKLVATYVDDLGNKQRFEINPVTIVAKQAKPEYEILPGRVTTGNSELDRLLMGGIPEGFAVALAAPSTDERQLLINRFLESGLKSNQTTLYITCEANNANDVATKYQQSYLVLCNPQADLFIQNLPNIYKLKGIENLTDIDISLTKLFKTLPTSTDAPKRVCIDLISDVLLQHHAVITRKWLSSLLANLKAKGFTTLAIVDPSMHLPEETQAVLSLFDGEARIIDKETTKGNVKIIRVNRLQGQEYLKDEMDLA